MDMTQEQYDKDKRFLFGFCIAAGVVVSVLFFYIFSRVMALNVAG